MSLFFVSWGDVRLLGDGLEVQAFSRLLQCYRAFWFVFLFLINVIVNNFLLLFFMTISDITMTIISVMTISDTITICILIIVMMMKLSSLWCLRWL